MKYRALPLGQREGEEDGEDAEGDAVTQLPLGRVRISETEIGEGQVVRRLVISDPFVQLCKLKRPLSCFIIVLDLHFCTYISYSICREYIFRFKYKILVSPVSWKVFCYPSFLFNELQVEKLKKS